MTGYTWGAHLEDALWLIGAGESPEVVAQRMGVTPGAVGRLLLRHGYREEARPFHVAEMRRLPPLTCEACGGPRTARHGRSRHRWCVDCGHRLQRRGARSAA